MVGGTTESIRQANLATILQLLYRGGPSSRATLSKRTGRNRSTIASLVADLADLGLVVEREPDASGLVGRPSPVVELRSDVAAIAVNPEIDVLSIGLVGLDGTVKRVIRHEYDRSPTAAEAISITAAVIEGMQLELQGHLMAGIGVAVPGQVRTADGVVRNAPHLNWHEEAFSEPLSQATGLPVWAANDAGLGALAEYDFGAGRSRSHLIYLNGGASGIGGGLVANGRLLGGAAGYGGELGHVRVSDSPLTDSAGISGTLEALVTRAELLEVLGLDRADPDTLEAALLADRSPRVRVVVERQLGHLGTALAAAINLLNPQVVVLGGFLAALLAYDPERLHAAVTEAALPPSADGVQLAAAELGSNLLMIGAAQLAFAPLLEDPAAFVRPGTNES
ncbi:MAG: ROK family transcriptional regulator [Propionicimonas sp.]|uniref:ROK family transcriptional regulator n=1 Tax=Propionicimonas sp. TaxID=1955623 RepID=UPI002B208FFF|nr:ROK family transcriptional regulator [Propionicimonas sp.]MEA4943506.1 ROK family transcriptional regulator [Propionicimonas sp.]MEA5055845.1 ROK family transcriptional regulator [Propionicimonas sp.]MEA5116354.1 ROK family transcriptional regulator [Propionicimonas sp.]